MKRHTEPVCADWDRQARSLIPAYMFTETWNSWDGYDYPLTAENRVEGKRGVCSWCGTVRHWTRAEARNLQIRHGAFMECPGCRRTCEIIASAKMPKRRRLEGDMRCVFCLRHSDGEVVSLRRENEKLRMAADPIVQKFQRHFDNFMTAYQGMISVISEAEPAQAGKFMTAMKKVVAAMAEEWKGGEEDES